MTEAGFFLGVSPWSLFKEEHSLTPGDVMAL